MYRSPLLRYSAATGEVSNIVTDDFESYTVGSYTSPLADNESGWDGGWTDENN